MHTIIGTEPHISVMGIPQLIIRVIMSQQALSISMLIMPVGIIIQVIPWPDISQLIVGFMGMPQQLIIGMPAHIIMQGVPFFIMAPSVAHISFILSIDMPSPGIIMHFMPLSVMEQLIRQDIGTIIATGIGMPDAIPIGCIIGICIGAAVCIVGSSYKHLTNGVKTITTI